MVLQALALPETGECVVIVEEMRSNADGNLMRIRSNGSVVWRADAPLEFGPYVKVALENGTLLAWSWSGHRLNIDPERGSVIRSMFVK